MNSTRDQYERFPYPPISVFALPRPGQGRSLQFESGPHLGDSPSRTHHAGIRILVAGCGTFEPLVVAAQHPMAREIVAVDLSSESVSVLKRRLRFARVLRPFARMAPVRAVVADLFEWEPDDSFDYIIASNMLHHVADPAALLARLSGWLKPGGLMRVVTYPRASRVWMRETGRYLRERGISASTPRLRARVFEAITALPARGYGLSEGHPLRSCFVSQPETDTDAGVVDAFLNACENPLSPLEWRSACDRAGLVLAGEAQTESSRSDFLVELEPATRALDAWTRLQILDDLLELCANPVLWLRKLNGPLEVRGAAIEAQGTTLAASAGAHLVKNTNSNFSSPIHADESPFHSENILPEYVRRELCENLARARELLHPCGVSLEHLLERLRVEVGPRVSAPGAQWLAHAPEQHVLPGLSILDYPDLFADHRTS